MNAIRLSRAAMVVSVLLTLAAALAVAFGGAAGCSTQTVYEFECAGPDGGDTGSAYTGSCACPIGCGCCTSGFAECGPYPAGNCPFVDAGMDGGDAGDTHGGDAGGLDGGDAGEGGPLPSGCTGECQPPRPDYWEAPQLLFIGSPSDTPKCPEDALAIVYGGFAGLDASPASCAACSCTSPTGTCALPSSITASAALCNEDGGAMPFDIPLGWDGGCTSGEAIPPSTSIQSVTIAPLAVQESGCTPSQPVPVLMPVTWSTFAWACQGTPSGTCSNGEYCASFVPAPGFLVCVGHEGAVTCPTDSPYANPYVFYDHTAYDTRSCSACACGSPSGSMCSADVSVYSDATCSTTVGSVLVGSNAPGCVEGIAGSAVGSTSAGSAMYTPGACPASGGAPTGSVDPVMPVTFCCLPPMGSPTE